MRISEKLNDLGIKAPSILLPKNADMTKWPVIACDQFTQDRDYWRKVKEFTDGAPSTLNLIFPEVFLNDDDASNKIKDIHSSMNRYLQDGVFAPARQGFIYIERDTPFNNKRRGLVAAVDLEKYDWHPDARPLIRCTEGTVPERLPPRMDIRRGAPLELPHVLLLIDDDTNSLLPALGEMVKNSAPLYNTPLMMNSGNISGWFLEPETNGQPSAAASLIIDKLDELLRRSVTRYTGAEKKPFLFAVGDGNHSLAAAKGIWSEVCDSLLTSLKYALVEIENIYDPAIQFEPIHRLVFDIGYNKIISLLSELSDFKCSPVNNLQDLSRLCKEPGAGNKFGVICEERYALIETSEAGIATACLQPLLDKYAKDNPHLIDYIHDEAELFRLSEAKPSGRKAAGILLPPVQKSGLFETVARLGPLPRKSFSMGHSAEKRFYLECRELN